MESIFSRYKNALVLMLVLLAQIVLLAMQVRRPAPGLPDGHNVRLWRSWVAAIVTPPERLINYVSNGTTGFWSNYIYLRHLKQQNERLQEENSRLRLEQASLAEDAREGQDLRRMLDFKGQYLEKTVPAQVIGTSGTDQARIIYIDKGSNDGLRAYMPVVTPDGVVGKLKNVFASTSQVLLISDQTSGTGVMLQSTRIRGVMKGNASGQPQIVSISPDERIKPGEAVITSGGDQVYPPGMPIGEVERVAGDPDSSFVNVVVKPAADLARLQAVLVVTSIADKMPFSQEKDLMQSEVAGLTVNQRAADVLSEKLPSLHDDDVAAKAPAGDSEESTTAAGGADPARPLRPPAAIHPDRYTPGAAPAAETLTPGQAPPMTHKAPSFDANQPVPAHIAKPAAIPATTAASTGATVGTPHSGTTIPSGAAPWPSRPKPITTSPTNTANSGTVSGTTTTATSAAASKLPAKSAASTGSGFTLPLQPADSTARRPTASASGDSSSSQPLPRTPRTAPATSATGGISSDGILEPAGMGQIGTPRPRPATPKPPATTGSGATGSGSTAPAGTTGASSTPKSASPRPATVPAQKPPTAQSSPPGGR